MSTPVAVRLDPDYLPAILPERREEKAQAASDLH